jgi:tRNA pseudouridine55 synthase
VSATELAGLLVVDKPAGPTSHDVVKRVRARLQARAGHAGTLDPQATGVLLVCIGAATRLSKFLQVHDKVYEGVVRLGWATDTYDADGEATTEIQQPPELSEEIVEAALQNFVGELEQVPPVYSAKKIRGEPSYRRARRGEEVTPKAVPVRVHSIHLLAIEGDRIHVQVHCGAGTYVRTLAHDLGRALACPAHLAALRRLSSGPFRIEDALPWDDLEQGAGADVAARILHPEEMLPEWPAVVVNDEGATRVAHGGALEPNCIIDRREGSGGRSALALKDGGAWIRVLGGDGQMLAAAELNPGGVLQPRVVLI